MPRVKPRREQLVRAERFRDLGLLDVLRPDAAGPHALSEWLAQDDRSRPSVRGKIDFGGLARLPGLLEEVIATSPRLIWSLHLEDSLRYVTR